MERCPACQARLKGAAQCPRCGADLDLLVRARDQTRQWMRDALASYRSGDRDHALECLREIDALDSSPASKRLSGFLRNKFQHHPIIRPLTTQTSPVHDSELKKAIIDCANQVYLALGEGLMLSAYEDCLSREMSLRGIGFKRDYPIAVQYKGLTLRECGHIHHLVEGKIALYLCPSTRDIDLHERRFRNWIRLGGFASGLLIDFDAG
ncbi:MAG: GxxExxY protein [Methylococcales bacterium]